MLKSIHIENIAVIQRADVEFSPGLNVLTGETGAGKSIVIDALDAVLGGRISRELVRAGAERAVASAVFESREAADWCAENELEAEGEELVLQRRVTADGKSSARCNGMPVSAAQLRELGALLLDIHGQNDGRQLLDERRHLLYLDRFGVPEGVRADYAAAYERWSALLRETRRLQMDEGEKQRLEESLRVRIQELEKAEIRPGEEEKLTALRDQLRFAEKTTEQLEAAYDAVYAGQSNAVTLCGEGENALQRASAWTPGLEQTMESIRTARLALEDAAERLRDRLAELEEYSPRDYDRLEERLALLRRLQRRYNTDEPGLAALLEGSKTRLDELEYAGDRLAKLEKELAAALATVRTAGAALTEARTQAAAVLEKQVVGELRELNMPSVRFHVLLESRGAEKEPEANGLDEVRFVMSANAGETPGPISRIASGGELSRIMLALKNVFAEKDAVPTLVFDEIDTGVSGVAAQRVGEKLSRLARSKQVLCVTHLPQIAALADRQLLVSKREQEGRTFTDIESLEREGRRRELARLHGGDMVTDAALRAAEEQLAAADRFKTGS